MMLKETVRHCKNSSEVPFIRNMYSKKKKYINLIYTNSLKIKPGFITEHVQIGKFIFFFVSV